MSSFKSSVQRFQVAAGDSSDDEVDSLGDIPAPSDDESDSGNSETEAAVVDEAPSGDNGNKTPSPAAAPAQAPAKKRKTKDDSGVGPAGPGAPRKNPTGPTAKKSAPPKAKRPAPAAAPAATPGSATLAEAPAGTPKLKKRKAKDDSTASAKIQTKLAKVTAPEIKQPDPAVQEPPKDAPEDAPVSVPANKLRVTDGWKYRISTELADGRCLSTEAMTREEVVAGVLSALGTTMKAAKTVYLTEFDVFKTKPFEFKDDQIEKSGAVQQQPVRFRAPYGSRQPLEQLLQHVLASRF